MAKQLVNPIERHVEKAVVGVAALLLIGVVAKFFLTSPNQMELGGETVTPATIDAKVAERAVDILNRIRNAEVDVIAPEPFRDEFVAASGPLNAPQLRGVAPIGPDVPLIDPPTIVGGHASLVTVLKPGKPVATSGRSTLIVPNPSGSDQHTPANWATVSAVFDVKGQTDLQRHAYGAARGDIVTVPPELQRRTRHSDGSWSEDDWEDVETWPAADTPPTPELEVIDDDGGLSVPPEDLRDLERFTRSLDAPFLQREMLRPLMAEVANGTEWCFPTLLPYNEILRQDESILSPNVPPSADPEDYYGCGTASAGVDQPGARVLDDPIEQHLKEAERLYEATKRVRRPAENNFNDAMNAYNMAHEIWAGRDANAQQKRRAEDLMRRADQLAKDINRKILTFGGGVQDPTAAPDRAARREPLPKQQVWAHDAAAGSLLDDRTYQYRIRFGIVNQLAGEPEKLDDPRDATEVLVYGEWSEPTDPITFEPASLYFVISDEPSKEQIGIEFYRWFDGEWVQGRRKKFGIGDRVWKEERVRVPDLLNPGDVDMALVEFSAGATILDTDFNRTYRERRKGTSKTGVRFGPPRTECSVVLVDSAGVLHERFVPTDKNHPGKRAAASRVWRPSK